METNKISNAYIKWYNLRYITVINPSIKFHYHLEHNQELTEFNSHQTLVK